MRFCPFCKEAFDDADAISGRCPSHDVELVTLRELGRIAALAGDDDAQLPVWSLQRGRGLVAVGALLMVVAFFLPFASLSGQMTVSNTLFSLARGRALRLWIVPSAAFALLLLLYRRRTGPELRGARLAALFVSLLPGAVVGFTLLGTRAAAALMAEQLRSELNFHVGLGPWVIAIASVLSLWGSAILGTREQARVR